jgi:L-iditol 2-dehydrogenase
MWAHTLIAPRTFARQRVRLPKGSDLAAGEVLLRPQVAGICGSDLPYYGGRVSRDGPLSCIGSSPIGDGIPGASLHEIAGEVVASRDPAISVGTQAVGWATSLNAAAEYVVTQGSALTEFGASLSPVSAVVMQPLACVISAVRRLPEVRGARAAIIGQGSIGILFSHVLKSMGASRVTGVDPVDRSDFASDFGVDEMVHAPSDRWAAGLRDGGDRPNIVIEAVGHQVSTMRDAVDAVESGGVIYYFGIPDDAIYPFPMLNFMRKDALLSAGGTPDKRDSLQRAGEYLTAHPELVDSYVTHQFQMTKIQDAFEVASRPSKGRLKVVLQASE